MHWDEGPESPFESLFEDLEQQAEGLRLTDRDAELVDRGRAEYAGVTFAARLHASLTSRVQLTVRGVGVVDGTLSRTGVDWCLLETAPGGEWVLRLAAVTQAHGLAESAVGDAARAAVTRLGLGSVLRGIAESRVPVLVAHLDGSHSRGRLVRVGADFVELRPGDEGPERVAGSVGLVPFAGVAGVRPG